MCSAGPEYIKGKPLRLLCRKAPAGVREGDPRVSPWRASWRTEGRVRGHHANPLWGAGAPPGCGGGRMYSSPTDAAGPADGAGSKRPAGGMCYSGSSNTLDPERRRPWWKWCKQCMPLASLAVGGGLEAMGGCALPRTGTEQHSPPSSVITSLSPQRWPHPALLGPRPVSAVPVHTGLS